MPSSWERSATRSNTVRGSRWSIRRAIFALTTGYPTAIQKTRSRAMLRGWKRNRPELLRQFAGSQRLPQRNRGGVAGNWPDPDQRPENTGAPARDDHSVRRFGRVPDQLSDVSRSRGDRVFQGRGIDPDGLHGNPVDPHA